MELLILLQMAAVAIEGQYLLQYNNTGTVQKFK